MAVAIGRRRSRLFGPQDRAAELQLGSGNRRTPLRGLQCRRAGVGIPGMNLDPAQPGEFMAGAAG